MSIFGKFSKNKDKADKAKTKDKKKKKSKRGFRKKNDFIKKMNVASVVESAFIDRLKKDLADSDQPYIGIDSDNHLVYLLSLTNDLIKGTTLETDSEALGSLTSAIENFNTHSDIPGAICNASFDTDLNPMEVDGVTPPRQVVFLPTVNTLNELSNIAGSDQLYKVVSVPSDLNENNYDEYIKDGEINASVVMEDDDGNANEVFETIEGFKKYVEEQTTLTSENSYSDEEMGIEPNDNQIDDESSDNSSDGNTDFDEFNDPTDPLLADDEDDGFDDPDEPDPLMNDNDGDGDMPPTFEQDDDTEKDPLLSDDPADDPFGEFQDDGDDDGGFGDLDDDEDGLDNSEPEEVETDTPDVDDDEDDEIPDITKKIESTDTKDTDTKPDDTKLDESEDSDKDILKQLDEQADEDFNLEDDSVPDISGNQIDESDESTDTKEEPVDAPEEPIKPVVNSEQETVNNSEPNQPSQSDTQTVAQSTNSAPTAPQLAPDEHVQAIDINSDMTANAPTAPEVDNEDEALVNIDDPDNAYQKIDPNARKAASLSAANQAARNQLRDKYSEKIDKWLKDNLVIPKLYKSGNTANINENMRMALETTNAMLQNEVVGERERIRNEIMNKLEPWINALTNPKDFHKYMSVSDAELRKMFLDSNKMQEEQRKKVNEIETEYQQIQKQLINEYLDKAHEEFNTKYLPERDTKITQVGDRIKQKHTALYNESVDMSLSSLRAQADDILDEAVNNFMQKASSSVKEAAVKISSDTKSSVATLISQFGVQNTQTQQPTQSVPQTQTAPQVPTQQTYANPDELRDAHLTIRDLKHELDNANSHSTDLENLNRSTMQQLNEAEQERDKYLQEMKSVKDDITRAKSERDDYVAQIAEMNKQLEDAKSDNERLSNELTNVKNHGRGITHETVHEEHQAVEQPSEVNYDMFTPNGQQSESGSIIRTLPEQEQEHVEPKSPKSGPVHSPQL